MIEWMTVALRSVLGGLLGGYLGYRSAIRGASLTERPPRRFLIGVLLASALGGTVLMFVAQVALALAAPNAPVSKLQFILTVVFAAGVGLNLTNWRLRKKQPK